MKEVNDLLNKSSEVFERYDKIASDTGEKFNIFTITKIERVEVNTHSAMIAELLNPSGSHGQGDVFLEKFIDCIKESVIERGTRAVLPDRKVMGQALVRKEKTFNGGDDRIDIFLEFPKSLLIIENKVDALDGKDQLTRYDIVGTKSSKDYCLLYLTKFGDEASAHSCEVKNRDIYVPISYAVHITKWLESCIKEVPRMPALREAIFQYLTVVKKIVGESMDKKEREELIGLLLESDNYKAGKKIISAMKTIKGPALYNFFDGLEGDLECEKVDIINEPENYKYIYNEQNCNEWFDKPKKTRPVGIGAYFDIGVPDYLFLIQVAEYYLYYGMVKAVKGSEGYQVQTSDVNMFERCTELERRTWGSNWYAQQKSNVRGNIDMLISPQVFISEARSTIVQVQKLYSTTMNPK